MISAISFSAAGGRERTVNTFSEIYSLSVSQSRTPTFPVLPFFSLFPAFLFSSSFILLSCAPSYYCHFPFVTLFPPTYSIPLFLPRLSPSSSSCTSPILVFILPISSPPLPLAHLICSSSYFPSPFLLFFLLPISSPFFFLVPMFFSLLTSLRRLLL